MKITPREGTFSPPFEVIFICFINLYLALSQYLFYPQAK